MKPSIFFILLASFFFVSCGEQTEFEEPGATNGATVEVTKEIQISVLPMQTVGGTSTRSASDKPEKGEAIGITYMDDAATRVQTGSDNMTAKESMIDNAYIVQFNGTAPTSTVAWVSDDIKSQLNSGSAIPCGFIMTAGKKNRVYVVANLTNDQETAILTTGANAITLSEFEKPVEFSVSETLPSTGLPMSSHQDVGVADLLDVFQLRSVLAKLTVKCTDGTTGVGISNMKLEGVPVGYSFNRGIPGNDVYRPSGMTYDNSGTVVLTSGVTYYVPENLSGRNELLIKHYTRAKALAPANAMMVTITNNSVSYGLLLGDGSANDFNCIGGYSYNIDATIYGKDFHDLRVLNDFSTKHLSRLVDMNADGRTANCYQSEVGSIVNFPFMFDCTVKGNGFGGNVKLAEAASAEILWEMPHDGTMTHVNPAVLSKVYLLKGKVLVDANSPDIEVSGNALVAIKDRAGKVIWSWHIWMRKQLEKGSDFVLKPITNGTSVTLIQKQVMSTTLGGSNGSSRTCLYYQRGRKDPLCWGYKDMQNVPLFTLSTAELGNEQTGDANPTTFYGTQGGGKWNVTRRWDNITAGNSITLNGTRYSNFVFESPKTYYDPCPKGYKVMPDYYLGMLNVQAEGTNEYCGESGNLGIGKIVETDMVGGSLVEILKQGWLDPATGVKSNSNEGGFWLNAGTQLKFSKTLLNKTTSVPNSVALPVICVRE